MWIDVDTLAGLDERGDDGPVLAATIGACEERIFTVQRDGADRALHDIRIYLDAAIIEEAGQSLPTRERVADRLCELGLLADQRELVTQPGFEVIDDRP